MVDFLAANISIRFYYLWL